MSWLSFVFTAPQSLRQESDLNCEFVPKPSDSSDPRFSGQRIKNIPITVRDNDGDANIRLSTTNITISEGVGRVIFQPIQVSTTNITISEGVGINLEDNDIYHVKVSQRSILRFDDVQGDTGASYTISLPEDFPPASGKNITILISNSNELIEVPPTQVSFSSGDRAPKVITVKRADAITNPSLSSIRSTITHTIDTTSTTRDTNYDSASIASVDVIMDCTLSIDCNGDGLIDIKNAEMLNNMRYNLAGSSYRTSPTDEGDTRGCPTDNSAMRSICRGTNPTRTICESHGRLLSGQR